MPRIALALLLLTHGTLAGCGGDLPERGTDACRPLHLEAAPPAASLVLIVNDTMRRDRVGAYGGPARTPVFDAFAGENLLFRRASTPAPWTKPAVASLFTALYPSQHGVRDDPRLPARNGDAGRVRSADVLATSLVTLAEVLRDAGFRTAAFVSNPWMGRPFGFDQGFEHYDDGFARFDAPGEVVSRAGLDWLAGLGTDERFFLYLHYVDAHQPYGRLSTAEVLSRREQLEADRRPISPEARAILRELRTEGGESLLLATPAHPSRALIELAYDRGISEFDAALGSFLQGLASHPADARTAVVITSDHGEALFERGYGNHARALHEDELAIPLAARLPGVRAGDRVVDCPVTLIDVMPTICHYFGLACPATATGRSWLVDAQGPHDADAGLAADRYVAAEGVPGLPEHRAIRNRRFKLIYEPGGRLGPNLVRDVEAGRRYPYSLYDLDADPGETRNLLAEVPHAEETEEAFATLSTALPEVVPPFDTPAPASAPLDPDLEQRLRDLGYTAE